MSTPVANIHDAFFKKTLSDPGLANAFLREHLPREIVQLLGSEPPKQVSGSFVDEHLRQHQSDLLFQMRLRTGSEAFAYILMEHKSSPDQGARLQLLRYLVRLLIDLYKQNGRRLPLPPVLPLIAHHGPQGWGFSCEFADLFGPVPEPLRPYLPSFRHALVDLGRIEDCDLSQQARLRAFLKALKYARRPDLVMCLDVVLAEAHTLDDPDLFALLNYLGKAPVALDINQMGEILERLSPERKERIMGWVSQPHFEKGKAEGEALMLSRFLERRFGRVPKGIREQIFAADLGAIERWFERAFDSPDLQSVFETTSV